MIKLILASAFVVATSNAMPIGGRIVKTGNEPKSIAEVIQVPGALVSVPDTSTHFENGVVPLIFQTDIFANDAVTREPASKEALRWTVQMGGCTGALLSPEYMLTAHHCGPQAGAIYTSGACLASGACSRDVRVIQRVEADSTLDYVILRVQTDPEIAKGQRYPVAVQTKDDELKFGTDSVATKLFTVGFPADKNLRATYAEGFAKRYNGSYMDYNVGSINGNSGGSVFAVEGLKLVGMTNHGPHAFGQRGWNGNNPEDSRAWNGGPKMPAMYTRSAVLRQLFPGGKNPLVDTCGRLK